MREPSNNESTESSPGQDLARRLFEAIPIWAHALILLAGAFGAGWGGHAALYQITDLPRQVNDHMAWDSVTMSRTDARLTRLEDLVETWICVQIANQGQIEERTCLTELGRRRAIERYLGSEEFRFPGSH